MEIAELQQAYLDAGGDEKDIEGITDEGILTEFLNAQQNVHKAGVVRTREKTQTFHMAPTDNDLLLKWGELQQVDDSIMTSDELRQLDNERVRIKNLLMERILPEPGMQILDDQLRVVVTLGLEPNLLDNYEAKSFEAKDIRDRLDDLKTEMNQAAEDILRSESFLEKVEAQVSYLKDNIPDQYIIDPTGHTIINGDYLRWQNEIRMASKAINARIRGEWSSFKDDGVAPDERTKIFLLEKEVCGLTGEEPFSPPKNYFSHTPDYLHKGVAA